MFITSRKEPDANDMFSEVRSPIIEIEARDSAKDIDVYVCSKIEELISSKDLKIKALALSNTIIQEVVSKADRM